MQSPSEFMNYMIEVMRRHYRASTVNYGNTQGKRDRAVRKQARKQQMRALGKLAPWCRKAKKPRRNNRYRTKNQRMRIGK